MKRMVSHVLLVFLGAGMLLSACVTARVKPVNQQSMGVQTDTTSLTVFLLERDIPPVIEKLGVVALSVNSRPSLSVDEQIKRQLRRRCQEVGANGAYRVNDGTYYPQVVNYLIFRYKK